jgi:hypothetical protein
LAASRAEQRDGLGLQQGGVPAGYNPDADRVEVTPGLIQNFDLGVNIPCHNDFREVTSATRFFVDTASRPTTEVLINSLLSLTRTFKPFKVLGSKVISSNATSPSLICAPSATNPAVTPLAIRGTRTGIEKSRTTGPAAGNVLACSSGCTNRDATCDWMRVVLPLVTSPPKASRSYTESASFAPLVDGEVA